MPRSKDCIYCQRPTGSGEHIFPAALGGRRKNKSILCRSCNSSFSALDAHLATQLQYLRGMLGVRPDHKDAPVPAVVPHGGVTLLVDAQGRPSYRDPVTLADEPLENGRRRVQTAFSNERQIAEWRAEQARKGLTVTDVRMTRVGRVMAEPVEVEWHFGGPETFREVARIALNFLAHHDPAVARGIGLRSLKDYIQGRRVLSGGEMRPVWYHAGEVAVPASNVELGHQVFIRLDHDLGRGYAVVRFFDAVDLLVDFGDISPDKTVAVLFDIDPYAEHEPSDLFVRTFAPDDFPREVPMIAVGDEAHARMGDREQLLRVLGMVAERQARLRLTPLSAELAQIQGTKGTDWRDAIWEELGDYEGEIYRQIEFVARSFSARFAGCSEMRAFDERLGAFAQADPLHPSGLTAMSRDAVQLARSALASAIAVELANAPMTLDRLVLLLEGGPGAAIVGQAFIAHIQETLDRLSQEPVTADL